MSNVSIRAKRSPIYHPRLVVSDPPGYFALLARCVLKCIFLVFFSSVPMVVEIRQAGRSFLPVASLVLVHYSNGIIIDFYEILKSMLATIEFIVLHIDYTVVGTPEHIKGGALNTLGSTSNAIALRVI